MTNQSISKPTYQTSAPATHAARTILRNFVVRELGRVEATENNLATMIDYGTQMFRIVTALDQVVKSTPWVNRDTLAYNLDRLREAVQALETAYQRLPKFKDQEAAKASAYQISAPSLHTARFLMQHFQFVRKAGLQATEKNLAIVIDVCTQAFRIEAIVGQIASTRLWTGKEELLRNLEELRRALRATEIVRNRTPRAAVPTRYVVHKAPAEEPEIQVTREQRKQIERFAQMVAQARTVQDQQGLLQKAGLVSHQAA